MSGLTRPLLRWHGGKWLLAPWIIEQFPLHRTYVEPFGGAASVLLRKDRSYAEIYNDLDDEVVNLFRVLRGTDAEQLVELIRLTPFARAEFELAYQYVTDPVERARRLLVRSFMGFGGGLGVNFRRTGFRSDSKKSGSTPTLDWRNYPPALASIVDRLCGVTVENKDATALMRQHDAPDTLHYVDPPYLHETRSGKLVGGQPYHAYAHELSEEQHAQLLSA